MSRHAPCVVLTYDAPHRKTQDVLTALRLRGVEAVEVVATPWVQRKPFVPQIPHRPWPPLELPPALLCARLGFGWQVTEDVPATLAALAPRLVLIAGAGVLPAEVLRAAPVLNAHPGYLPQVRGLDALKWAVVEDLPIGVTLHQVDETADAGWLIHREEIPLYAWDTFHSLAWRQYEREVALLAEAPARLARLTDLTPLEPGDYPLRRRMPRRLEDQLLARFEARRRAAARDRSASA